MVSLMDEEIEGPGALWYERAKESYVTFEGDKSKFMNQARLWLDNFDLGLAEIAWDLVDMEHNNEALG